MHLYLVTFNLTMLLEALRFNRLWLPQIPSTSLWPMWPWKCTNRPWSQKAPSLIYIPYYVAPVLVSLSTFPLSHIKYNAVFRSTCRPVYHIITSAKIPWNKWREGFTGPTYAFYIVDNFKVIKSYFFGHFMVQFLFKRSTYINI